MSKLNTTWKMRTVNDADGWRERTCEYPRGSRWGLKERELKQERGGASTHTPSLANLNEIAVY